MAGACSVPLHCVHFSDSVSWGSWVFDASGCVKKGRKTCVECAMKATATIPSQGLRSCAVSNRMKSVSKNEIIFFFKFICVIFPTVPTC